MFNFVPKMVRMLAYDNANRSDFKYYNGTNDFDYLWMCDFLLSTEYRNIGFKLSRYYSYGKKSVDGKTFYWYCTDNANVQFNAKNYIYYWFALM